MTVLAGERQYRDSRASASQQPEDVSELIPKLYAITTTLSERFCSRPYRVSSAGNRL